MAPKQKEDILYKIIIIVIIIIIYEFQISLIQCTYPQCNHIPYKFWSKSGEYVFVLLKNIAGLVEERSYSRVQAAILLLLYLSCLENNIRLILHCDLVLRFFPFVYLLSLNKIYFFFVVVVNQCYYICSLINSFQKFIILLFRKVLGNVE